MPKPTFASKTEELCTCGFLSDSASGYYDAQLGLTENTGLLANRPLRFDPNTNEYFFVTDGISYRIHHCILCGGAAPPAMPRSDYAIITYDEEARIASQMESVSSLQDAEAKLGKPDIRTVDVRIYKDEDGKQRAERLRQVVYNNLSPLAELWITENLDRTISYYLQSKRIDDSQLFDWSTIPKHLHPDYLPAWKKMILRLIGVEHGTNR